MNTDANGTSDKSTQEIHPKKNKHQDKNRVPKANSKSQILSGKTNSKLSLIIAMIAIITALSAWVLLMINTQSLAKLNKELSDVSTAWHMQYQNQETQVGQFQSSLNRISDELSQQLTQTEKNSKILSKLTKNGSQIHEDVILYETEYLLRIANLTLIQQGDVPTTLSLLTAADEHLVNLDDPTLTKVRGAIASEIAALKAVPNVDVNGIYNQLSALIDQIPQLPTLPTNILRTPTEPTDESKNNDRQAQGESRSQTRFSKAWAALQQLIIIRHHDQGAKELLPIKQHLYLEQNLRLNLQQAQWALLRANQAIYQQNIAQALAWLSKYFNTQDPTAKPMIDRLKQLVTIVIKIDLPDIDQSLSELRFVIHERALES